MVKATASALTPSDSGPALTVTAQQSRFHVDLEQDNATGREVVVKDLSISLGERELLSHTNLSLQPGRHYVLVGRNGVGKSTLLRAIASGTVPGIPTTLKVLLLGQTQEAELGDAKISESPTVLEHVVRSDRRRERLLNEASRLSAAMESDNPNTAVLVYREVLHERLETALVEAQLIATRRSGARGIKARKALIAQEEALAASTEKLSALRLGAQDGAADIASDVQKAQDLHTDVQTTLETLSASTADAKARTVLLGLGFSAFSLDMPVTKLSGGWQTRLSLACALCQSSDLLLLDEPTNYLDLPSIMWLERYVKDLDPKTIVIVVTHDRAFADAVGDELLVLRHQVLEVFKGTVSAYEVDRLKKYKYLTKMQEAQDKQKKHMQSSIDNHIKAAKKTGDDKKLKQAASRKKKLEERTGMEVSAKGGRFKLNRDLVGYHLTARADIDIPDFDPPATMVFPSIPADLRFPGALVSFEHVDFSFGKGKAEKPILRDVSLTIHPGERVGLVGLNGSGKSTLVSLIVAGADGTIANRGPKAGSLTRHTRARIGLYTQQAVEELSGTGSQDESLTALSHLMQTAGESLAEQAARALLSGLGLPGRTASDVPIALLSGGQKVRLALAKVLWRPPQLLILDEVTTHLDSDTIQALAFALRKYEGAVLLITHDRFFMRCVVEGESPAQMLGASRPGAEEEEEGESSDDDDKAPGVVYRLSKGKLGKLERGMEQYEEIAARASVKLGKT